MAKLNISLLLPTSKDYLFTKEEHIIPIEVKSGTKSRRAKNLDFYITRDHPPFAFLVRLEEKRVKKAPVTKFTE